MYAYVCATNAIQHAEVSQYLDDSKEGGRREYVRRVAGSQVLSSLKKEYGAHSMREVERKRLGIKQSNFKDICAKSISSGLFTFHSRHSLARHSFGGPLCV